MTQKARTLSQINLPDQKKVFFASDFHLGAPSYVESRKRETKIIQWLTSIEPEAHTIFLLGDIFDFWFEYRHVIPKGYTRFLAKLAALKDNGLNIVFFSGNHDMWMFDYFPKEFGIPVYHNPHTLTVNNTKLLIGHGDGLGGGDYVYKLLKKAFRSPLCQWAFNWLHPNVGMAIAHAWSKSSRQKGANADERFLGNDEWIYQHCKKIEATQHYDYYVFGHRHLPLNLEVGANSRYINLGQWLNQFTYGRLGTGGLELLTYNQ